MGPNCISLTIGWKVKNCCRNKKLLLSGLVVQFIELGIYLNQRIGVLLIVQRTQELLFNIDC